MWSKETISTIVDRKILLVLKLISHQIMIRFAFSFESQKWSEKYVPLNKRPKVIISILV
jgi:hypothetical protein